MLTRRCALLRTNLRGVDKDIRNGTTFLQFLYKTQTLCLYKVPVYYEHFCESMHLSCCQPALPKTVRGKSGFIAHLSHVFLSSDACYAFSICIRPYSLSRDHLQGTCSLCTGAGIWSVLSEMLEDANGSIEWKVYLRSSSNNLH